MMGNVLPASTAPDIVEGLADVEAMLLLFAVLAYAAFDVFTSTCGLNKQSLCQGQTNVLFNVDF